LETALSKDGTAIAYWRGGTGKPLLLVHGTTCDHTAWSRVQPELERQFCVCIMDRRGRGQSGDNPDYAHEREVEDLAAVIDAIGGPVDVLGHSFGALCALEAMRLTTNMSGLILYEPPMAIGGRNLSPEQASRMNILLNAGEKEQALLLFLRDVLRIPAHLRASMSASPRWPENVATAHTIPRECRIVGSYTFDPKRFLSMRVPTVLLVGSDSPPPQHAIAAAIHAALPQSRIVLLRGEQHFAPSTSPGLFARELSKLLAH
jgi:pimeloyl-ACP methyl ester carboxylesterase